MASELKRVLLHNKLNHCKLIGHQDALYDEIQEGALGLLDTSTDEGIARTGDYLLTVQEGIGENVSMKEFLDELVFQAVWRLFRLRPDLKDCEATVEDVEELVDSLSLVYWNKQRYHKMAAAILARVQFLLGSGDSKYADQCKYLRDELMRKTTAVRMLDFACCEVNATLVEMIRQGIDFAENNPGESPALESAKEDLPQMIPEDRIGEVVQCFQEADMEGNFEHLFSPWMQYEVRVDAFKAFSYAKKILDTITLSELMWDKALVKRWSDYLKASTTLEALCDPGQEEKLS